MKKILVIDDDSHILRMLKRVVFQDMPNVILAECHNEDDAMITITTHKPEIILLDNSLSPGGNEGLSIVRLKAVEGIKIYSTTSSEEAQMKYEELGIEHVGKSEIDKISKIANS